ncbi:MAG TPA: hypothetical protein VE221_03975, partial [Sphingomicrobium sp.]|nr:hypothetical protein [Sphingomicrobium sp.]
PSPRRGEEEGGATPTFREGVKRVVNNHTVFVLFVPSCEAKGAVTRMNRVTSITTPRKGRVSAAVRRLFALAPDCARSVGLDGTSHPSAIAHLRSAPHLLNNPG